MAGARQKRVSGPELAERVVDAALLVTRLVRREVGRRQPAGLSVSAVRALSLLARSDGVSLAELAEHVGLGAPPHRAWWRSWCGAGWWRARRRRTTGADW